MPLFRAPLLAALAALCVLLAAGVESPAQQKAAKKKAKTNPPPAAKPKEPEKPLTAWEEYLLFAPSLSMPVEHWSVPKLFGPADAPGKYGVAPPKPNDARLRKAVEENAAAKRKIEKGADVAKGSLADPLVQNGIKSGVKDGIGGALQGDDERRAVGFGNLLLALGSLKAQEMAGNEMIRAARVTQVANWREVVKIPREHAGPAAEKPPLRFEIVIGPMRERSLNITNTSEQDLTHVTLFLRTSLSDARTEDDADHFAYTGSWKKGETRQFSRELVSRTTGVFQLPLKSAFVYSVWCDQLKAEDVALQVPSQQPPVKQGGTALAHQIYACTPQSKGKK